METQSPLQEFLAAQRSPLTGEQKNYLLQRIRGTNVHSIERFQTLAKQLSNLRRPDLSDLSLVVYAMQTGQINPHEIITEGFSLKLSPKEDEILQAMILSGNTSYEAVNQQLDNSIAPSTLKNHIANINGTNFPNQQHRSSFSLAAIYLAIKLREDPNYLNKTLNLRGHREIGTSEAAALDTARPSQEPLSYPDPEAVFMPKTEEEIKAVLDMLLRFPHGFALILGEPGVTSPKDVKTLVILAAASTLDELRELLESKLGPEGVSLLALLEKEYNEDKPYNGGSVNGRCLIYIRNGARGALEEGLLDKIKG